MTFDLVLLVIAVWVFIGLAVNYTHGRRRR